MHQSGSAKQLKAGEFLPDFQLINNATKKNENRNAIVQGTVHHLFIFSGPNTKDISKLINFTHSLAIKYPHLIQVHLVLD